MSIAYAKADPVILTATIDRELAFEYRNDPDIWQWCRQHTLLDFSNHMHYLSAQEDSKDIKLFGLEVWDKSGSHNFIGVCGFTGIDMLNRRAEFSLYIAPEFQSHRYAPKALYSLLKHGFEDWGFNKIWGEVYNGNPALKTFLRMGFQQEGLLRKTYFRKGQFIDTHYIGMLAEDFYVLEGKGNYDFVNS